MTNEKTESEIFEEQLNSLYKPLNPTPKPQESENKTNQGLANQSLAIEPQKLKEQEDNEPSYLSTGIAYLDDKIKNRTITAFDYYMAKKFLGMDLNVNLNGNLNIKSENQTRVKNLTSATSKIYDGIKALNLGDRLIQKAQDNSGFLARLKGLLMKKLTDSTA